MRVDLQVSMVEIYNDHIRDLLCRDTRDALGNESRANLELGQTPEGDGA